MILYHSVSCSVRVLDHITFLFAYPIPLVSLTGAITHHLEKLLSQDLCAVAEQFVVCFFLSRVYYPLKSRISDVCEPFWSYRDETECLIQIMRSRTPDLCFEDHRDPGSTANGFEKTPFSTPAKLIDPQSSWGPDILPPSNVRMSQLQYSTLDSLSVKIFQDTCQYIVLVLYVDHNIWLHVFQVQVCCKLQQLQASLWCKQFNLFF